jgi:hypothetical protein
MSGLWEMINGGWLFGALYWEMPLFLSPPKRAYDGRKLRVHLARPIETSGLP